jgi:adenylate cyclase
LSEHLGSEALISLLNDYFECIVGPVEEGGGEVLKFIGDAVLAVFPLPKRAVAADVVCEVALAAAENAVENVLSLSASRQAAGDPPIDFGVALHVGDVVFGNVGSEHRLDFTVIGRDVNLVSRLQDLSARLTQTLILSDAFVSHSRREFVDLGSHALKGIATDQRAHSLKPSVDTVIGHQ